MPITSCFRRLCQTSAGSKSRCVQQSFVYNSQDAWIKESRWVKCLVLRSLFARRIDHIHLSPKEWSASAKLGISGRLRVPSFARNISNILLLEVIGTAIPTACQVAYETELNAMHIAAGLGSCEAMEALTHGTNDEELPSYLAYLAIWHTHFCPCCESFLVLPELYRTCGWWWIFGAVEHVPRKQFLAGWYVYVYKYPLNIEKRLC